MTGQPPSSGPIPDTLPDGRPWPSVTVVVLSPAGTVGPSTRASLVAQSPVAVEPLAIPLGRMSRGAAIAEALGRATGDYLIVLDDGDSLAPRALAMALVTLFVEKGRSRRRPAGPERRDPRRPRPPPGAALARPCPPRRGSPRRSVVDGRRPPGAARPRGRRDRRPPGGRLRSRDDPAPCRGGAGQPALPDGTGPGHVSGSGRGRQPSERAARAGAQRQRAVGRRCCHRPSPPRGRPEARRQRRRRRGALRPFCQGRGRADPRLSGGRAARGGAQLRSRAGGQHPRGDPQRRHPAAPQPHGPDGGRDARPVHAHRPMRDAARLRQAEGRLRRDLPHARRLSGTPPEPDRLGLAREARLPGRSTGSPAADQFGVDDDGEPRGAGRGARRPRRPGRPGLPDPGLRARRPDRPAARPRPSGGRRPRHVRRGRRRRSHEGVERHPGGAARHRATGRHRVRRHRADRRSRPAAPAQPDRTGAP